MPLQKVCFCHKIKIILRDFEIPRELTNRVVGVPMNITLSWAYPLHFIWYSLNNSATQTLSVNSRLTFHP